MLKMLPFLGKKSSKSYVCVYALERYKNKERTEYVPAQTMVIPMRSCVRGCQPMVKICMMFPTTRYNSGMCPYQEQGEVSGDINQRRYTPWY